MAGSDDEATPPGWYRQAEDPELLRWWDGDDWTDDTMPVPAESGAGTAKPARSKASAKAAPSKATPGKATPGKEAPHKEAPNKAAASRTATAATAGADPGRTAAPRRTRRDVLAESEAEADRQRRTATPEGGPPPIEILLDPASEPGSQPSAVTPQPAKHRGPGASAGPGPRRTSTGTVRVILDDDPRDGDRASRPRQHGVRPQPRAPQPDGRSPGARQAPPRGRTEPGPVRPTRSRGERLAAPSPATAATALRVLVRAGLIAVVVAVAWVGYAKLRDAEPARAQTLADDARSATVDPDAAPLDQVVLTLADLPRGWSAQNADPADDDICEGRIPQSVIQPTGSESALFTTGEGGSLLGSQVQEFVDDDTAKAYVDLTARTTDACREYSVENSMVQLTPMDFPRFGDQTFVAAARGEVAGGSLHGTFVYVRAGNRVASIITISVGDGDVDTTLIEHLAQLVARRMTTRARVSADLPGSSTGGGLPGE